MPPQTTINSVQAEDPQRTAISAVSGRDQVTVAYTPTQAGQTITGVRIEEGGGTAVGTGRLMARHGLLCSDTIEACSDSDPNMVCSDWTSPSGTQLTDTLTYPETGGVADGPETIYVWAASDDSQGYA